jgi:3D (Asp-Asp-Asp) domain-containing protein
MGTLLAELASKEILTAMTVKRLREYISNKYPQLSPAARAGIFADAVNRIVAVKLPELPEDKAGLFRALLYGDAAKKQAFSIDCSDVFKSSLKLKTTDMHFIKGLAVWLEGALLTPVSEEKVSEYVVNACRMLDEAPDMDMGKVLDAIERDVGDVRPKKRVISLIHMNPAGSRALPGPDEETGASAREMDHADEGSPDKDGSGRRDTVIVHPAMDGCGTEDTGGDWIVIRKRRSAGEIIADRMAGPASYIAGIRRRITGFVADTVPKGPGYRIAAISGLIAAALLCTFLFALYVNGDVKAGTAEADDIMKAERITSVVESIMPENAQDADEAAFSEESGREVLRMRATAYDLSVESCGKDRGHPQYGITYSGTRAEAGRTVAVDPEVIPLGSSIRITFPEEYSYMDGIYVAEDTGRLIKGNSIDIFLGEDENGSREINKKAMEFGVQYVEVEILGDKQALR